MNQIKTVISYFLVICLSIYMFILFFLPNFLNQKELSDFVQDTVFKQTGCNIVVENPTLSVSWNLNLLAKVKKADIFYKKKKFAQLNDLDVNIALLPLAFKTLKITDINASKFMMEIPDKFVLPKTEKQNMKLFKRLPSVDIGYLRVSVKDGNNIYAVKANNFSFYDSPLQNKMRIRANGSVLTNKTENIKYDAAIVFNLLQGKTELQPNLIFDLMRNLKEYGVKADVVVDADVTDLSKPQGVLKLSKVSFLCNGKRVSPSFANLNFDKGNVQFDSQIFTSSTDKIKIVGNLENGVKRNLDLRILSDEISIKDLLSIAKTFAKPLGIKELEGVFANGVLKADFNIKSDFKKIVSKGNMFVKNANLAFKGLSVDKINAEVDFSGNKVNVKNATAFIAGYPLSVRGFVDTNAKADFNVSAKNLAVKNETKAYSLEAIANLNVNVKGNLKKIVNDSSLKLTKLKLKDKVTGMAVNNSELDVILKGENGSVSLFNTTVSNGVSSMLIPMLKAKVHKDSLELVKTGLFVDNIKADISGKVKNLLGTPVFENVKLTIPTQKNLSAPMNSRISIGGELILNGDLKTPELKGSISVPKYTQGNMSVQNAVIYADNGLKVSCPYITIGSSIIRLTAYINNVLSGEITSVNITSDYLDLSKIKAFTKNQPFNPNIKSGSLKVNRALINGINAENIKANLSLKNDILYLKNLRANAYFGEVASDIKYNIKKDLTSITIQGRELDSHAALTALSGKVQDIRGRCDFDGKFEFTGDTISQVQKTLKGDVKFIISNFHSNNLGKLDYLIQAQNVLSNASAVKQGIKIFDTGVYKYARGNIYLEKGFAYIKDLQLAGPAMSLYISGRYYLPTDDAFLLIMGRVSNEIASRMGEMKETYIPVASSTASAFMTDVTTSTDLRDVKKIPELTVKTNFKTREFKVLISGDINKQTSVKTFKWIDSKEPVIIKTTVQQSQKYKLPDFIDKLPSFKN